MTQGVSKRKDLMKISKVIFHIKPIPSHPWWECKKILVTLRKCHPHLQHFTIDLSFSIKLQEINLNVCEGYKIERKARGPNKTERDDRIARPRRAQTCEQCVKRAMGMCPQSGQICIIIKIQELTRPSLVPFLWSQKVLTSYITLPGQKFTDKKNYHIWNSWMRE